jgi:hypothetical protein
MSTWRDDRTLKVARILGRVVLGLSIVILLVFTIIRIADMRSEPGPADAFGVRYVEHPGIALLHILPGLLFLVLAPLQFVARIRRDHIRVHRWLGRVLIICAAISGLFALAAAFLFPAYMGVTTQSATVFFGVIFLVSLAKAYFHIRHKRVALHNQWIIRVVAVAMGVASIRLYIALFMAMGFGFDEVFGASFWLGLGTNLLIAEIWINQARSPARQR